MVRLISLLFLVGLQVWLFILILSPQEFRVVFLDVGQGDAIYIQDPNGNDILIDGGRNDAVLRALAAKTSLFNRDLDVVLGTHPDADHIGGLIPAFDRYAVTHFLDPGIENDTVVYKELMERVGKEAKYTIARAGMRIYLSKDTVIEVLSPDRAIQGNTNNTSVITRISYKDTSILLTGDAGKVIERTLLTKDITSNVLKAGHHGSNTSSDEEFVRAVQPDFVVISAGKDNKYGHPHEEVLRTLSSIQTKILGTYDQGSIEFISDGDEVWLK